jgi:hypothetical protein
MKNRISVFVITFLLCTSSAFSQSILDKFKKETEKTGKIINDVAKEIERERTSGMDDFKPENNGKNAGNEQKKGTYKIEQINMNNVPNINVAYTSVLVPPSAFVSPYVQDDMICIADGSNIAYINSGGNYVFGFNLKLTRNNVQSIGTFSGGAVAANRNGKSVILYPDGTMRQVPDNYEKLSDFVDGVALALKKSPTRSVVYVDINMKEIYPQLSQQVSHLAMYDPFEVQPASEGLRAYYDYKEKKWGYADEKGKKVITPQFKQARPFSEGLATVQIEKNYNKRWGYIDKTGKIVIEPIYIEMPSDFSDELSAVCLGEGRWENRWGYINKSGKLVSPEYYACNNFSQGFAFFQMEKDVIGVLQRSGNFAAVTERKITNNLNEKKLPVENIFNIVGDDAYRGIKFIDGKTAVGKNDDELKLQCGRIIKYDGSDTEFTNEQRFRETHEDGTITEYTTREPRNYYYSFFKQYLALFRFIYSEAQGYRPATGAKVEWFRGFVNKNNNVVLRLEDIEIGQEDKLPKTAEPRIIK